MKVSLRNLMMTAAIAVSSLAFAQEATLTQEWRYNAAVGDAVGSTNERFGVAYDGKFISSAGAGENKGKLLYWDAETKAGLYKDLTSYVDADGNLAVAMGINHDDAGNLVIFRGWPNGTMSTNYLIVPADGSEPVEVTATLASGEASRTDQLGYVLGDVLSDEGGYLFIGKGQMSDGWPGSHIDIVKIVNGVQDTDYTIAIDVSKAMTVSNDQVTIPAPGLTVAALDEITQQSIGNGDEDVDAQPVFYARQRGGVDFVYVCNYVGAGEFEFSKIALDDTAATDAKLAGSSVNGFTCFALAGKTYFVYPMNPDGASASRGSQFGIFDEEGKLVAYSPKADHINGTYSVGAFSVEPCCENEVYLYQYRAGEMMAKFKFSVGEHVDPVPPVPPVVDPEGPIDTSTIDRFYFEKTVAELGGLTPRRVVAHDGKVYILAHDAEKAATIFVLDIVTREVLAKVSTEGMSYVVAGLDETRMMTCSDIQVTSDGVLIASNLCAGINLSETGEYPSIYKWANDENGLPTGAPTEWLKLETTGMWLKAYLGESIAYLGSSTEGTLYISSETAGSNPGRLRFAKAPVVGGAVVADAIVTVKPDKTTPYFRDGLGAGFTMAALTDHSVIIAGKGTASAALEVDFTGAVWDGEVVCNVTEISDQYGLEVHATSVATVNNYGSILGVFSWDMEMYDNVMNYGFTTLDLTKGVANAVLDNNYKAPEVYNDGFLVAADVDGAYIDFVGVRNSEITLYSNRPGAEVEPLHMDYSNPADGGEAQNVSSIEFGFAEEVEIVNPNGVTLTDRMDISKTYAVKLVPSVYGGWTVVAQLESVLEVGVYRLTVEAGAVKGITTGAPNAEVVIVFAVVEPDVIYFTPEAGEVESISLISANCDNGIMPGWGVTPYLLDEAGNKIECTGFDMYIPEDKMEDYSYTPVRVDITFDPAITAPGKYTLVCPDNVFVTGSMYTYSVEQTVEYTVVAPVAATAYPMNPYAYGLSSTFDKDALHVTYSLSTDAKGVSVNLLNAAGEAVVTAYNAEQKIGTYNVDLSLAGLAEGDYTWEVVVEGEAREAAAEFFGVQFYHPRGVDIDINPESPAFGTIYVTEGMLTTDTQYYSGAEGTGLYVFNPNMTGVQNADGGLCFNGGYSYVSTPKYPADPARVRVAKDGRIFVTRSNDAGDYISYVENLEDLKANNKFNSLLTGYNFDAATYVYTDAEGKYVAAANIGLDVRGEGESLQLAALNANAGVFGFNATGSVVATYDLGTATVLPAANQIEDLTGLTIAPQVSNVTFDPNTGGIWYSQYRGTPSDTQPALIYMHSDGQILYWEGEGGLSRGGGGLRFSLDGKQVAIASSKTEFTIYDVTYAEDGTPTLTANLVIAHGIGTNCYDLAWDIAGNIYICGNSGEWFKGFALPTDGKAATPAAGRYGITVTADGVTGVSSIEAEADANAVYYNTQGIQVPAENVNNGIYIKVVGNKASKVFVK